MDKVLRAAPALAAAVLAAACTVHQTDTPALTGPSEFGLSLGVTATPDVITADGLSKSTIVVKARDPNGSPKGGVTVHLDLTGGGTLSASDLTSGSDGSASTVYTAPIGSSVCTVDPGVQVTILATTVQSNFQTAQTQSASIRLLAPPAPPFNPNVLTAGFRISPCSPTVGAEVQFDGQSYSHAAPGHSIVTYDWDMGDGDHKSGPVVQHDFVAPGSYTVTLSVIDDAGRVASYEGVVVVTQ
ncbi:MAG: PKD domain-containing protein [Betaproteobacteria bacterium]